MVRERDARVKLLLAAGALAVACSARRPQVALAVAALAATSLVVEGSFARLRVLGAVALAAAIPTAAVAWLRGGGEAALLGSRVAGATLAGVWLMASADLPSLSSALLWLRLPRALVELLGLAHRYTSVFGESLRTARDAQALRLGYAGVRRGVRSVSVLAGVVLTRAVDQTATLSEALELRGYRGRLPLAPPPPLSFADARLALAGALLLSAASLLELA